VKYGLGAVLGTGKQYISWIHIFDLCNIILFCINNNSINGLFNAVSPSPVTNKVFTKEIARVLKMPILLPKVPPLLLKIILGEMSSIVLKGVNVSCEKIQKIGFQFKFEHLHQSLLNLFEE